MIVAVNGKSVGGMTEAALGLELDTGGSELILVVSRHKHAEVESRRAHVVEQRYLAALDEDINDERLLHWTDLGVVPQQRSSGLGRTLSRVWKNKQNDLRQQCKSDIQQRSAEACSPARVGSEGSPGLIRADSDSRSSRSDAVGKEKVVTTSSMIPPPVRQVAFVEKSNAGGDKPNNANKTFTSQGPPKTNGGSDVPGDNWSVSQMAARSVSPTTNEKGDSDSAEEEWEDDGNAWCGCVCGVTHDEDIEVFWIQCEGCGSWYNVSEHCVGFGEDAVTGMKRWVCCGCEEAEGRPVRPAKRI